MKIGDKVSATLTVTVDSGPIGDSIAEETYEGIVTQTGRAKCFIEIMKGPKDGVYMVGEVGGFEMSRVRLRK